MSLRVGQVNFKSTLPQPSTLIATPQTQPPKEEKTDTNKKLRTGGEVLLGTATIGLSILAFSQRNTIKNLMSKSNQLKTQTAEIMEETLIPFTVKNLQETALYSSFRKSKQGFMEFISNAKSPAKVKEFLFGITTDKTTSAEFIREVTRNPREGFKNAKILKEAIGGEKNLTEWLYHEKGYNEAYGKYLKNVSANTYTTIDDMIKISPNWHLFHLLDKTSTQVGAHKVWHPEHVKFGKMPEQFEKLGDFRHFSSWLIDTHRLENPELLEYGGVHFKAQRLSMGLSNKVPVKIEFCDAKGNSISKPYVLKKEYAPQNITDHVSQAYRSDSNFLDSQIDYYLNLHKCENATPFHYYDFASDTSIYDFVKGTPYDGRMNIIDVNRTLKDLNKLGMFYNDINPKNFIVQDGVPKIIDSGESLFHDLLRPASQGMQFELPNWAGLKLPNYTINKFLGE